MRTRRSVRCGSVPGSCGWDWWWPSWSASGRSSSRLFRALREMALQHRLGPRIGLLQVHAPVFELFERDRDPGHGATHEGAGPDDTEIPVEKLDLRFACHRRWAIVAVEHRRPR